MQAMGSWTPRATTLRRALSSFALAVCAATVICGFVGAVAMLAVEVERVIGAALLEAARQASTSAAPD